MSQKILTLSKRLVLVLVLKLVIKALESFNSGDLVLSIPVYYISSLTVTLFGLRLQKVFKPATNH